jgi:ketosteroid isomerase-like protein
MWGERMAGREMRVETPDADAAVRQWFELLERCCVDVDYESARAIFATDVASFGTKAEVVVGLGPLQRQQWEGIWPNIRDFGIDLDHMVAGGSESLAWGIAPWTSTGFSEDGTPFDRPGRATVVLERRGDTWLAVHTHFSLNPRTPARTHGPGGRSRVVD